MLIHLALLMEQHVLELVVCDQTQFTIQFSKRFHRGKWIALPEDADSCNLSGIWHHCRLFFESGRNLEGIWKWKIWRRSQKSLLLNIHPTLQLLLGATNVVAPILSFSLVHHNRATTLTTISAIYHQKKFGVGALGGPLLVGITCRECSAQNNPIALVPTGKVQRYPLFSSVFLPHLGGKFIARCQPVVGASKLVDYFGLFSWINCGYLPGMFSAAYVRFSTYQRWTFLLGGTSSGVDVRDLLLLAFTYFYLMKQTHNRRQSAYSRDTLSHFTTAVTYHKTR